MSDDQLPFSSFDVEEFDIQDFDFDHLSADIEDGIATIIISRPKALNALNQELIAELNEVFDLLMFRPDVRVVILSGEGRAFVAGADITEFLEMESVFDARSLADQGHQLMKKVERFARPVIAAINGFALGGGLELALAANLRTMSTDAKLGLPEVGLGLIPGYGGTQRLPRLIGQGRALDLILTARHVDAEEALQLGVVNRIADDALAAANELARLIKKQSPSAVHFAREAVLRGSSMPLDDALEVEADLFALATQAEDFEEGTRAFLDRRTPEFQDL